MEDKIDRNSEAAIKLNALDEGQTPLDPDEIGGLIIDVATRSDLNNAEHLNIQTGVAWGAKQIRSTDPLDTLFMRRLHAQMFGNVWAWAGRYRTSEKNIGVDPVQIAVRAQALIEDARYWIANEVWPIDRILAEFHHRLVLIHCFPNGNGRHARAITDLVAQHHGAERFSWGTDFEPANARSRYIDALRQADAGNIEQLLHFCKY